MALFIYLWQRSEMRHDSTRKELNDLRDAYEVKTEAHTKTLLDLQEKRIVDAGRSEAIVSANTTAMGATSTLLQGVISQLPRRRA
jgi:hypothetical protein